MVQPTHFWAEGAVSLRAILSASSREIYEVFYTPKKKNAHRAHKSEKDIVLEMCRKRGIPTTEVDDGFLCEHAEGTTHGGLLARVGEKRLSTPETLCQKPSPFLAYLCGIEDPYNFAACLRTLYAAGCDGIFLPERNWLSAGALILRSSAGASEHLPMAQVPTDADAFLSLLCENQITPVCAREKRAENLFNTNLLSRPLCLIIGGEKRGIDRALDEKINGGVVIPYGNTAHTSLSAQAACAVLSFEILRRNQTETHE